MLQSSLVGHGSGQRTPVLDGSKGRDRETMTPKEKALELFDKYWTLIAYKIEGSVGRLLIKQCALIAVDEIINGYEFDSLDIEHKRIMDNINFWDEVKQEIEKL
jgi:hypothetical protein